MTKAVKNPQSGPEISLAYLHDIADGSNEFMVEMIDIFLQQTPDYLNQIEQGIEIGDWATVAEIAHKIRPTFAFIGVDEAKEVMAVIENKARSGEDLESIAPEFREFKTLSAGVLNKLIGIRNDLLA